MRPIVLSNFSGSGGCRLQSTTRVVMFPSSVTFEIGLPQVSLESSAPGPDIMAKELCTTVPTLLILSVSSLVKFPPHQPLDRFATGKMTTQAVQPFFGWRVADNSSCRRWTAAVIQSLRQICCLRPVGFGWSMLVFYWKFQVLKKALGTVITRYLRGVRCLRLE